MKEAGASDESLVTPLMTYYKVASPKVYDVLSNSGGCKAWVVKEVLDNGLKLYLSFGDWYLIDIDQVRKCVYRLTA